MADEQTAPQLKEFTLEEVSKHTTAADCWMIIKDEGIRNVYDVTKFLDDHPGGPEIILDLAGQDATDEFEDIGHSNDARLQLKDWLIGKIEGDVKQEKKEVKKSTTDASGRDQSASGGGITGLVVVSVAVAAVALFFQFGH